MKSSEALKEARKRIEAGTDTYLCRALNYVWLAEVSQQLDALVFWPAVVYDLKRILGESSVTQWLDSNSHEFRQWKVTPQPFHEWKEQLRIYRLRWIDEMIAQYEEKGD